MNTEQKQTSGLPTPALPTVGEPRITRKEARDAIMLQLRKWREDGQDMIYFGCLNIHPDLPDETTFGQLIDIAFDTHPAHPAELNPPSVEQIQKDNPHMDGLTRVDVRRTNRGVYVAIVGAYSTKYAKECRADYVWSVERQRWELGAN